MTACYPLNRTKIRIYVEQHLWLFKKGEKASAKWYRNEPLKGSFRCCFYIYIDVFNIKFTMCIYHIKNFVVCENLGFRLTYHRCCQAAARFGPQTERNVPHGFTSSYKFANTPTLGNNTNFPAYVRFSKILFVNTDSAPRLRQLRVMFLPWGSQTDSLCRASVLPGCRRILCI